MVRFSYPPVLEKSAKGFAYAVCDLLWFTQPNDRETVKEG